MCVCVGVCPRCLCRLTLDSGRPGAVVEDSQLSKHLPRPHVAQHLPLLRHDHLAVCKSRTKHTSGQKVPHIQTAHLCFLLLLGSFFLCLPTRPIQVDVGEMEWMMVCLRVLASFWGGPQPECFLTHWTGKIKNTIIFRHQVFSRG